MKKTFKTILALVMAAAMMAGLCVTAMADYPEGFNYVPGNKPNDIIITDGTASVSLKEKQDWPEDLSLVDTAAIAENVAYTLFVNGQNYQPVIDCQDVYHFVVFSPICFAVPLCWAEGVEANCGEFTIVAFGFDDGAIVDYDIIDPLGKSVYGGQAVVEDNIGYPIGEDGKADKSNGCNVMIPKSVLDGMDDGLYSFVIDAPYPGDGNGDGDGNGNGGRRYRSYSPFGVLGHKFVSALNPSVFGGKKKREINYYNEDWPVAPQPQPKKVTRDIGHGFTVSTGTAGLGAHYNVPKREVTLTIGNKDLTIPTSGLVGDWKVSDSKKTDAGLNLDFPSYEGGWFGNPGSGTSGTINIPSAVGGLIGLFKNK